VGTAGLGKKKNTTKRVLLVANRLPVSVTKRSGRVALEPSAGGLATGLASLPSSYGRLWVGWPGVVADRLSGGDIKRISGELGESYRPVFLAEKHLRNYYRGFCNKTIWPLFHYFPVRTVYEIRFWEGYRQVNDLFCEQVAKVAKPGDCIWVHDYHLMLLPQLLRERLDDVEIGFFLHIPFPSFELFRLLPWRHEILKGLLNADLIGFHTFDYVRHFFSSVSRLIGLEHNFGNINVNDRIVRVDAFPMGIDYRKYSGAAAAAEVKEEVERIRRKVGDCRVILSVDRLDYTKGIVQRLEAFDLFLSENPSWKQKVTLIMVAVPSRTGVEEYREMRDRLEQLVGRINGEHGTIGWMPVWYLYRFIPFNRLSALYSAADVALVTPLRDGMNLIAKEFIAAKTDGRGVLILSEMAGAAGELGEALTVNANNKAEIVTAIGQALRMPPEEQVRRNRLMQHRLARYTVSRWAADFMHALSQVRQTQQGLEVLKLTEAARKRLLEDYAGGRRRLLLLDYDGTLVGFAARPEGAGPDAEIIDILGRLSADRRNEIVIVSGRDKATIDRWLGGLDVSLVAEHGAWIRKRNGRWRCAEVSHENWKKTIRPILDLYAERTPGAIIEEKEFSLVWHYRRAERTIAEARTQELKDAISNLTANMDVGVFEGSKILEIRSLGINKGRAVEEWLLHKRWNFILAAGDDYTDEDMFEVVPKKAYSIKVGFHISRARFNVDSESQIRLLLQELAGPKYDKS
jgi:trehalose 6-phosphate synthase/phosphatase